MRKIMNNKIYDTKTSTPVAEVWNGKTSDDLAYFRESLRITRKGNYFLHIEGGPYSSMGVDLGNGSTGGSADMRALKGVEVDAWLHKQHQANKISVEDYIKAKKRRTNYVFEEA